MESEYFQELVVQLYLFQLMPLVGSYSLAFQANGPFIDRALVNYTEFLRVCTTLALYPRMTASRLFLLSYFRGTYCRIFSPILTLQWRPVGLPQNAYSTRTDIHSLNPSQ